MDIRIIHKELIRILQPIYDQYTPGSNSVIESRLFQYLSNNPEALVSHSILYYHYIYVILRGKVKGYFLVYNHTTELAVFINQTDVIGYTHDLNEATVYSEHDAIVMIENSPIPLTKIPVLRAVFNSKLYLLKSNIT